MLQWIWTIIIGFVAGLIAKAVTPGSGPSGFWLTAILGIAGALAATFVGQLVGWYPEGHPAGFINPATPLVPHSLWSEIGFR